MKEIQEILLQHVPRLCLLNYEPVGYTHQNQPCPWSFEYVYSPVSTIRNTCLGITSFVNDDEHLVLLDFLLPVNEENTKLIIEQITPLYKGLLVNSGNSYHFYSYKTYSYKNWQVEMYKALLIHGIDHRYIGHRLIDGYANLRISDYHGIDLTKPMPSIMQEI